MAKDDAQKPTPKTTTDAKSPVNAVQAPVSTESQKPRRNRNRNRNKKPGGANTAAPAQKQPEQKRRLNKDERYELAKERCLKAIERIKAADDDGNVSVRTYGLSYDMVAITDNIALMQEIQNDMANQMKRAVKSIKVEKADKFTGIADIVGLFNAEVNLLAEKAQAAVDMFLAEGYGPRYARDAHAKRTKAQKNDEVVTDAAIAAPDAPKTTGTKAATAAAAKAAEEVK